MSEQVQCDFCKKIIERPQGMLQFLEQPIFKLEVEHAMHYVKKDFCGYECILNWLGKVINEEDKTKGDKLNGTKD